ncbi:Ulp1 protease family, carboxy-terminal domain protein [Arachis hypogaea]|nr:Ulp1 protease family, carboxy-terminal domain protein [Arachis hypogaea]
MQATNRDGQLYELDVVKCEVERLRSLTIPLTFEIPKDMLVNEEEAMVAIYLYNANASPDEEILVHEGVNGCRRSFDALKPMRQIDANILTMVACTMTHEEKIRSGGPKIWFLPPRVSEQALSFVYPPIAVVMDHSAYLYDVSNLSKIYVPIKDNFKHWYLLCVDVKKRKLICVDSMQQRSRKTIRERQIRLANFIDWMIHEQLLDERIEGKSDLDEVAYQLGEFRIYYRQNLPQQENA